MPALATTLTVDKLAPAETAKMLAAEQQALVRKALTERVGLRSSRMTPALVEGLRQWALGGPGEAEPALIEKRTRQAFRARHCAAFVETLRRDYKLNARSASRQKERITRTGFTLEEQVLTVDTALRMMGMTKNFARTRPVLRSRQHIGQQSVRIRPGLRRLRRKRGQTQRPRSRHDGEQSTRERTTDQDRHRDPSDTHFLAGQMDTTTDEVQLFDLEDVPPTHRADLSRLQEDLKEAAALTSHERCGRFPDIQRSIEGKQAEALYIAEASTGARCVLSGVCRAIRHS